MASRTQKNRTKSIFDRSCKHLNLRKNIKILIGSGCHETLCFTTQNGPQHKPVLIRNGKRDRILELVKHLVVILCMSVSILTCMKESECVIAFQTATDYFLCLYVSINTRMHICGRVNEWHGKLFRTDSARFTRSTAGNLGGILGHVGAFLGCILEHLMASWGILEHSGVHLGPNIIPVRPAKKLIRRLRKRGGHGHVHICNMYMYIYMCMIMYMYMYMYMYMHMYMYISVYNDTSSHMQPKYVSI